MFSSVRLMIFLLFAGGCVQLQPGYENVSGKSGNNNGPGWPIVLGNPMITGFTFTTHSTVATISGNSIQLSIPASASKTGLIAMFRYQGTGIRVGSTPQVNAVTANDFTAPVVYTVYDNTGISRDYTVTVTTRSDDVFPPLATLFEASPATVTSFPATVTLKMYYSEVGGSGIDFGIIYVCSPSQITTNSWNYTSISTTNMGGYFQGTFTVQNYHEAGTWKVCGAFLGDQARNMSSLTNWQFPGTGNYGFYTAYSTSFNTGRPYEGAFVVSGTTQDITPPTLVSVSATPSAVGSFPATVTMRAYFNETGSGLSAGTINLCGPTYLASGYPGRQLYASGVDSGGYFQATVTIQNYHEAGAWRICEVYLTDRAGNFRSYGKNDASSATNFSYFSGSAYVDSGISLGNIVTVSGTVADITAPTVTSVVVSPATVFSYPASVTVRIYYAETGSSGLDYIGFYLCSPSYLGNLGGTELFGTSTTVTAAYIEGTVQLQSYHETGTWKLCGISARDKAGNHRSYEIKPTTSLVNYSVYQAGIGYTDSGVPLPTTVQKQ